MNIFDAILASRGLDDTNRDIFLHPDYSSRHDPFLLPDMEAAVERLVKAQEAGERITIYGDYDIDGLTATTVLLDGLASLGFANIESFIPNRFVEGYGMTVDAVDDIIDAGAQLIVTVDCGSLSHKEIAHAKSRGVDVIVTDHHAVADIQPEAVAVINPKRTGHSYPFVDLAGVGVAFKLIQALQTRLPGLEGGKEKWLLDLVALGTVCDVVSLMGENRTNVYWGLEVLKKTRRPGLRALMAVADVEPEKINARSLGFGLGPRMNASGRLETAQYALDMLRADDPVRALEYAQKLDMMNQDRRKQQREILKEATQQAEAYKDLPVLVVSAPGWNHGIIGIVAANLLEAYKKPTFVLEEMGDESKGSARSYGDFSAVDAIRASDDIITKGGGHKLAAGVTMPTANISAFRERVNEFYRSLNLSNQVALLDPIEDVVCDFADVDIALVERLALLEPYGNGNPEPILRTNRVTIVARRTMGADNQHVKYTLRDTKGAMIDLVAFGIADQYTAQAGDIVDVWYQPTINEWRGIKKVEGWLKRMF